jgi:DNA-binding winged helix-turn-helix (wHTH) protein/Tol biopolymer transport system component
MTRQGKHLFEFGPFRVDSHLRILLRDGQLVSVPPKAFDILLTLIENRDKLVLKEDLMKAVWPDAFVEESNLTQNIFVLRRILREAAGENGFIVTVPGRGYGFAAEVKSVWEEQGQEEAAVDNPSQPRIAIEEEARLEGKDKDKNNDTRSTILLRITVGLCALLVALAVGFAVVAPPAPPRVLQVRQITQSGRIEPWGKVLTDGARLYFTERRGGVGTLAEVPVAGGDPKAIPTSVPSLAVYDIDPSSSRLLIGNQGPDFDQPLWVVSTEGGSARRVGDVLASEGTIWSRDGHSILYTHDAHVYRASEQGSEVAQLLSVPGYIFSLRLSPDGRLLRFTVQDSNSGVNSLWEASADGRNPHPLSLGWKTRSLQWGEGETAGDWTPDGRYFLFRAAHDGVFSLWAIREHRSWFHRHAGIPVQLYTTPAHIGETRFSPDGKKLFVTMHRQLPELVRYDRAQRLFVPYLSGIPARLLSFSSDGQWVAYRSDTDNTLWRSRVDGTEKLQLTFPPMEAYHSSWSPDGKRIIFGGSVPGERGRLYSVSSDGGAPEALTSADNSDSEPTFAPDGRFAVFLRWNDDADGSRYSTAAVLDLGTRQVRLLPGTRGFEGVHWSPDGKYVAASDQVRRKLVLFDVQRQEWSDLAEGPPYGWGIRWSSDSRYIYYQLSDQGEDQPIFRVGIRDHKIEQITSARQIVRADVLGYIMTGLTPGNEPLATLVHRTSDIYALDIDLP